METNYFGVLRCIKAVLPRMRERRNGCIVNGILDRRKFALPPFAPYNAAKFALEALSEVLAQEVKPFNIRVAIIEPGIIATPMAERISAPANSSIYPHRSRIAGMFQILSPIRQCPPWWRIRFTTLSRAELGTCGIWWVSMQSPFSIGGRL